MFAKHKLIKSLHPYLRLTHCMSCFYISASRHDPPWPSVAFLFHLLLPFSRSDTRGDSRCLRGSAECGVCTAIRLPACTRLRLCVFRNDKISAHRRHRIREVIRIAEELPCNVVTTRILLVARRHTRLGDRSRACSQNTNLLSLCTHTSGSLTVCPASIFQPRGTIPRGRVSHSYFIFFFPFPVRILEVIRDAYELPPNV